MKVWRTLFAISFSLSAILLSFSLYSPLYYRFFGSDMAIHVLMASDFAFSDSLYYWGQNRLGSLLPIMAIPLIKVGVEPILSVSIVQYGFLVSTWLLTRIHFKKQIYWYIWLLIILFPPFPFKEAIFIGHPYAVQFFIVSLMIWIISRKQKDVGRWTPILVILFGIGIWVSEMILALPVAYALYLLIHYQPKRILNFFSLIIKKQALILIPLIGLVSFAIWKVKSISFHPDSYSQLLASPKEMMLTLKSVLNEIWMEVSIQNNDVYAGLLYVLLIVVLAFVLYKKISGLKNPMFLLFAVSVLMLIASHWVYQNEVPMRYFGFSYWALMLFLLGSISFIENKWIVIPVAALPLLAFLSLFMIVKNNGFLTERWNQNELKSFAKRFENVAVIGDYWHSYVFAAYQPNKIIPLPHDKEYCRNYRVSRNAFLQDTVVIIKDDWMPSYPDSIRQFGRWLVKNKEETIGRKSVGLYTILSPDSLTIYDFSYPYRSKSELIYGSNAVILSPVFDGNVPSAERANLWLDKGSYKLRIKYQINEKVEARLIIKDWTTLLPIQDVTLVENENEAKDEFVFDFFVPSRTCIEIRLSVLQGKLIFSGADYSRVPNQPKN